jgi:hydroxyacylglutathione hydrolase
VAYYGAGSLFCGDTLFACGCGRLFEGTPEQMMSSLAKLAALPDDTKVYCGHEYTLANIAFAQQVEPANRALAARSHATGSCAKRASPPCPRPLGRSAPPIRSCAGREPAVVESANKYLGARISDPVRVFAAIREWKNRAEPLVSEPHAGT